jgi:hypothetical protein
MEHRRPYDRNSSGGQFLSARALTGDELLSASDGRLRKPLKLAGKVAEIMAEPLPKPDGLPLRGLRRLSCAAPNVKRIRARLRSFVNAADGSTLLPLRLRPHPNRPHTQSA